ncbi:MAG: molybdopterin molybdotransferase MoeA, partial [Actinomycetota bacterium]
MSLRGSAPGTSRPLRRGRPEELLTPEEVLGDLLAGIGPLPSQPLPLATCAGLVVAHPVRAPSSLPRFTNSAMDGFALRHEDGVGPRRLVGRALAGEPWSGRVGVGEAVAVATGAVLPDGADTVVPCEMASVHGETVEPQALSMRQWANVRRVGEVATPGDVLVPAGFTLGAGQLAICAAAGVATVEVHPRPVVAILPTGTEVRAPGEPLGPGGIHDAVTIPLVALLEELGAVVRAHHPVPDDRPAIMAALRVATDEADLVITVGGVSVGERDLVKDLNS